MTAYLFANKERGGNWSESLEQRLDLGLLGNLFAGLAVGTLDAGVGTRFEQLLHGIGVILVQRIQQSSVAKVVLDIDLFFVFFFQCDFFFFVFFVCVILPWHLC